MATETATVTVTVQSFIVFVPGLNPMREKSTSIQLKIEAHQLANEVRTGIPTNKIHDY